MKKLNKVAFNKLLRISKLFSRQNQYKWLNAEIEKINQHKKPVNVLNVGAGGEIAARLQGLNKANLTSIDVDAQRGMSEI